VARGIPFVIAAPSGTGKTTVCRDVMERDANLHFSVSHTTRDPRGRERDGVDYHFVARGAFLEMVEREEFLEHAEYSGNLYGTSHAAIEAPLARGDDLLLEIEVDGARQVRERRDDARLIFLLPPSMERLEERLRGRGTDSEEQIQQRLATARRELEMVQVFDYAVINDQLEVAVQQVLDVIRAERRGESRSVRALHGREGVLKGWRESVDS
jgi:guanylate kinase